MYTRYKHFLCVQHDVQHKNKIIKEIIMNYLNKKTISNTQDNAFIPPEIRLIPRAKLKKFLSLARGINLISGGINAY